MRVNLLHFVLAAITLSSENVYAVQCSNSPAKNSNAPLIEHPNLFSLPSKSSANAKVASSIDASNIQGDILVGMQKNTQQFYFFNIVNASDFKQKLRSVIHPLLTSVSDLQDTNNLPANSLNIAFSHKGLVALNITEDIDLKDTDFTNGLNSSTAQTDFNDDPSKWVDALNGKDGDIHGVLLLNAANNDTINTQLNNITNSVGSSIKEVYRLFASVRPDSECGHEHFGFLDGIGQPLIKGFDDTGVKATSGWETVDPGLILLGEQGDVDAGGQNVTRPAWAKDGSFLAFRQLQQLVPEFHKFSSDNAIVEPGLNQSDGAELFEARMIGRWKSGAPIDLSPISDNQALLDDSKINNFNFSHPDVSGFNPSTNVSFCPFSAHIRKTLPRSTPVGGNVIAHFGRNIRRSGIPYGPEVTSEENSTHTSDPSLERGLAFVAYQATIANGFKFLQQTWANNPSFPESNTGLDGIIGANRSQPFDVVGLNPTKPQGGTTILNEFVVSRGGEYFFSPSISAVRDTLSA